MPAKDRYHDAVVQALIKAGWTITNEQYTILIAKRHLWIDIRAINESESLVILVEVKGFEKMSSAVRHLMDAIGKYMVYRAVLRHLADDSPLYLAVPEAAYQTILSEAVGQEVLQEAAVRLIVFDPEKEEIIQWIH